MSSYAGDIRLGDTIDIQFTSRAFATGIPTTLAGSPVVSAYIGNSTTQITAGITLTVDLDSVVGLNNVRIVASGGNGYATATNITLVITTGTVSSVSVVGEVCGAFSIENRSALMPTTAARTLDVSAGGEAGIDWANVGSPTTTQNLSGTSTKALEPTVAARTLDVSAAGNAGIDWANIDAPTTTQNLSGTSTKALEPTVAARTLDVTATGAAGIDWGNVENPTTAVNLTTTDIRNVGGTLNGFTAPALAQFFTLNTTKVYADAIAGSVVYEIVTNSSAGFDVQDIVDGVWDEPNASHVSAGTTGANLAAAGAGTDPWGVALPGAYSAGEAGFILGTNLNALITSRMATYTQPTGFLAATFPGTVASPTNITAGTITTATNVTSISANGITANSLSTGALTDIENAVWDAVLADHLDAGSTGLALSNASSGTDPWDTPLPGAYAVGSAGYILGNNLDAQVSAIPADVLAEFQGDIIPVNIKYVNDILVIGSGTTVDPWNPTP